MHKRVAITAMAVLSPLGCSEKTIIEGIKKSVSAARYLDIFPADKFPNRVSCQIREPWMEEFDTEIPEFDYFKNDRKTLLGILGVVEVLKELGDLLQTLSPEQLGISLGIGINNIDFEQLLKYYKLRKEKKLYCFFSDILKSGRVTQISCDYISQWIVKNYGFRGPIHNNLSACAASSQAIGMAYRWISSGQAKLVLTGGADCILNPIGISGFSILGTLTSRNDQPLKASRPFDLNRDGFVPGEGCGILVMEEYEQAVSRGAKIYGEVCGYGTSMDAFKLTAPCEAGQGATNSMNSALRDAGWSINDVEYINAHGTSTLLNDISETRAIKKVFGERAYQIPISSCKSQIGHLIAASGAVETIMCLLALREGIIPATINLEENDPECDLNYVPCVPMEKRVSRFLKNSFALGGQNATLAYRVQQ